MELETKVLSVLYVVGIIVVFLDIVYWRPFQ